MVDGIATETCSKLVSELTAAMAMVGGSFVAFTKIIDRLRLDERLAGLAEAIAVNDMTARTLYRQWREQLDRSDTAIDRSS